MMEQMLGYFYFALALNMLLFSWWLFKTLVIKAPLNESLIALAVLYFLLLASFALGILFSHVD